MSQRARAGPEHQLLQVADPFEVPACDAVKIRCRRRRTFSSAARQLTASQPEGTSSGPFTTIVASNLPLGSGVIVIVCLTGSPDRVSALSGPGTSPVSSQLSRTASGGPAIAPGFPAAFRPPAFASRSPCSRPGPGPSLRSAYRAPPRCPDPPRGFHVSHLRDTTGVGAPSTPGTAVLSPAECRARPAPAASQRPVPAPRTCIPPAGLLNYGASTGVHAIHPSGLPLTCDPRMGREALGLSPVLRTPPLPAAHDRAGPGREHAPGTTLPTSSALQSASPLA